MKNSLNKKEVLTSKYKNQIAPVIFAFFRQEMMAFATLFISLR